MGALGGDGHRMKQDGLGRPPWVMLSVADSCRDVRNREPSKTGEVRGGGSS